MLVRSLVMRMAFISLTPLITLLITLLTLLMGAILILKVSLMLIFGLCEGVFLLRKITITVDDVTLDCLRAMREFGIPCSAPSGALCGLIIKISLLLRPLKKNRSSAGGSAVEVDYYVIRF